MPSVELTGGRQFAVLGGETLLEAAARDGIRLPHSCKTGRCSACKCKVLRGTTRPLVTESSLTESEIQEGWILACARTAETNVLLEADDFSGLELPVPRTFPCRIDRMNRLCPDVVEVTLRLPPAADFRFIPGQYIDVIDTRGIRRSYSLANPNTSDRHLTLHVGAVEGGAMSEYWFNRARVNDLLRLHGPLGTFFLRDTVGMDLIFIATGTGIAPVHAMLGSMGHLPPEHAPRSVKVLWGGRKPENFYLDATQAPFPPACTLVLSRPTAGWTGARGYVQDVLLADGPDLRDSVVYACGSNAMIRAAKLALVDAGLQPQRFHSDAFVSSGSD